MEVSDTDTAWNKILTNVLQIKSISVALLWVEGEGKKALSLTVMKWYHIIQCFLAPVTDPPPAPSCINGKIYSTCGTACPLTCDNHLNPPLRCTLQCVIGCFCPHGLVELGDSCVPPTSCPGKSIQLVQHNISSYWGGLISENDWHSNNIQLCFLW